MSEPQPFYHRVDFLLATSCACRSAFLAAWLLRSCRLSLAAKTAALTKPSGYPRGLCEVPSARIPTSKSLSVPFQIHLYFRSFIILLPQITRCGAGVGDFRHAVKGRISD
jgi:hypothetical protein